MEYSALEMGKRIRKRERKKDTEIDRLVPKLISFKGEVYSLNVKILSPIPV